MPTFILTPKSIQELKGVHQDLVAVVRRTIELSAQNFAVHDGLRTLEEQKDLLASGASQTLDSRHLTGHAVDLVPLINSKLKWAWPPIYKIADAARAAGKELNIPLRWGGAWNVTLTATDDPPEDLLAAYVAKAKKAGKKPFLDGVHFELPKQQYP